MEDWMDKDSKYVSPSSFYGAPLGHVYSVFPIDRTAGFGSLCLVLMVLTLITIYN